MTNFEYRLTEDQQYALYANEQMIRGPFNEVALALDRDSGVLHKHGDPEMVLRWHHKTQQAFRANGFDDIADDLVVIQGRFTLEDLNRAIGNVSYAGHLYRRLMEEDVSSEHSERFRSRG